MGMSFCLDMLVSTALTTPRGFDGGDVYLFHRHHRVEDSFGDGGIGVGIAFGESERRDLPGEAPFVFAPAALAFLAAVIDDGVPVAVGFFLILRRDLERERFAVLELRPAVQARGMEFPTP